MTVSNVFIHQYFIKFMLGIISNMIILLLPCQAALGEPALCPRAVMTNCPICAELRSFPGCGIFSAKLQTVPGKLGWLVTLTLLPSPLNILILFC